MFDFNETNSRLGTELCTDDQHEALRRFTNRFTGDNQPEWTHYTRSSGQPYKVQFTDDQDWLAHTRFMVDGRGRLLSKAVMCYSTPTWPEDQ